MERRLESSGVGEPADTEHRGAELLLVQTKITILQARCVSHLLIYVRYGAKRSDGPERRPLVERGWRVRERGTRGHEPAPAVDTRRSRCPLLWLPVALRPDRGLLWPSLSGRGRGPRPVCTPTRLWWGVSTRCVSHLLIYVRYGAKRSDGPERRPLPRGGARTRQPAPADTRRCPLWH